MPRRSDDNKPDDFATLVRLSVPVGALAAILVLAISLMTNYVALRGDAASLESAVRTAFETGALPMHHTIGLDRGIGAFTYNDCLILTMALERRLPIEEIAVSPARLKPIDGWHRNDGACERLFDAFMASNQGYYSPAPYHRYISAPVGLAAWLVPHLGVKGYRSVLKFANYLLCAALLSMCVFRLVRFRHGDRRARRKMIAGTIVFGVVLVFSGMEYFAQNLSIGLADLSVVTLYGFLIFSNPGLMRRTEMIGLAALFFALITAFEYWTGHILMAIAGGIGLIGLDVDSPQDRLRVRARTTDFVVTALVTVLMIVSLKLGLASLVFSENLYSGFLRQLSARAGGTEYGVGNLVLHLGGRLAYVGQGSLALGLAQATAALAAGVWGLRVILNRTPQGSVQRSIACSLSISVAAILTWHLIFRNQSTIHAHFMIRTFSWASAAGWIMLAVAKEVRAPIDSDTDHGNRNDD